MNKVWLAFRELNPNFTTCTVISNYQSYFSMTHLPALASCPIPVNPMEALDHLCHAAFATSPSKHAIVFARIGIVRKKMLR